MNRRLLAALTILAFLAGCASEKKTQPLQPMPEPKGPQLSSPSSSSQRLGDEVVICGKIFHIGTPVVLWTDKGGYNAYSNSPGPVAQTTPIKLEKVKNVRMAPLTDDEVARVKKNGWTLPFLQKNVDQFVIHYDVCGTSRTCFKVLHDRGLSVQFMLDLDGTIYQTMDLQEEALHATDANGRSVGVEIANMGAYGGAGGGSIVPLMEWYKKDADGDVHISLPQRFGNGGIRTPNFVGHPARNEIVTGQIQGATYHQYDFTNQQYNALAHLTAALCTIFPKIQCDYPRQSTAVGPPTTQMAKGPPGNPATRPSAICMYGESGVLIPHTLTHDQYDNYQGVLGHYHVQTDKQDPGPAFQWDRVINQARNLMTAEALLNNSAMRDKPAKFIPSPPENGHEKE